MIDRVVLKDSAASRRNTVAQVQVQRDWNCEFCTRDFRTEAGFMQHRCRERERIEELRSPRGTAAYQFYSEWMRVQKRSVPPPETFMTSKQYNYFLKFADWSEKTAVPNPQQFIKIMVETETQPILWCRSATFTMYLQWYDKIYPPAQQFIETFDALKRLAAEFEISTDKIYGAIGVPELAKMVRRRKLSPWLLVVSPNFLRWIKELDSGDQQIISDAINIGAYAAKLNECPALAKEFRIACEAENI